MSLMKKIGYIIEFLGIASLFCAAVVLLMTASDSYGIRLITGFGGLGLLFVVSGMSLQLGLKPVISKRNRVR